MKITNLTNVKGFFKAVKKCEGRVELVSNEGDRINLKSTLSQYVAIAEIFSAGSDVAANFEILVSEPKDLNTLMGFLTGGE